MTMTMMLMHVVMVAAMELVVTLLATVKIVMIYDGRIDNEWL